MRYFILFTLSPVAFVALVVLLADIINPAQIRWSSVPLPTWFRWVGVGLGVLAGIF